jgi:hypothetical protein
MAFSLMCYGGRKIRLITWDKGDYLCVIDGKISDGFNDCPISLSAEELMGDWEEVL